MKRLLIYLFQAIFTSKHDIYPVKKKVLIILIAIAFYIPVEAQTKKDTLPKQISESTAFVSNNDFTELDKYLRTTLTVDEYLKFTPLIQRWKDFSLDLWRKKNKKN